MRAAVFAEPGKIDVTDRPDPRIVEPTDAIVRVVLACVCGSDLWFYRGQTHYEAGWPVGHEFIAVVEETGAEVRALHRGDVVIAPFAYSDGTCPHCQAGITTSCVHGGFWAHGGMDGGQREAVRVPFAEATLVRIPDSGHSAETMRSLLALSDVMGTGHQAAVSAGVKRDSMVAVVSDGAVGLSGVLAAARIGAKRIIALSRHEDR
jgi:threonine dehydrogenase-like Zn-dependent dehydrogenase